MTPSQRSRDPPWRAAAPPAPLSKHLRNVGGAPQARPRRRCAKEQLLGSCFPPPLPRLPLFHTRYAEESAERPRLVTVVHPSSQNALRKITVLLNRRGVVSFEQLLLDISEALGFPRWHRARVTRLFTTHAHEIKGVCDFFRGDPAFLALGRARPDLGSVREALEELFPDASLFRDAALEAWERKLRPAADKTAKADSGYSEGMDGEGTRGVAEAAGEGSDARKKDPYRKPAQLPNHLQRLRLRGGVREPRLQLIGPFRSDEALREAASPALCEKCLARRSRQVPEGTSQFPGRAPLPPVTRRQKGSPRAEQEVRKPRVPTGPESPRERRSPGRSQLQDGVRTPREKNPSDVTEEDIERCYDIGRIVGDGNFAVVRECRRRDTGQTLAVKIVERSKLAGREHMMQNELSLLGSLRHPRVVRLYAHRHTATHSYLVMELVSGGDLFEAISERGTFCEAEAGLMVSDVSEALDYIHRRSIVHRDVKPENLLIERVSAGASRLKLGDFGLAMVVTEPVFTICGTPTYVAPEILNETGYGVAVDVWALGVILYILLCGFPPFRSRDRNQEELFQLIKQGRLHFPSPFWDHISEEARGLVGALLQPDPAARLNAGQALVHPWVKAMAADGRQGALKDKAPGNTINHKSEQDQVQPLHQNKASEAASGGCEFTQKQPRRASEGLHAPPGGVDWPQRQDPGPESSNADCNPGNRISLCNYFSGPVGQMDPLPQIKAQSQQNGQQRTSGSANQGPTVSGHPVSTRPPSNPATASPPQPLHQQNSSCSLYKRNSPASQRPSSQAARALSAHPSF